MFASSKVSQSMIDAVNKVLGENQSESNETVQPVVQQTPTGEVQQLVEAVKETTPTGVKVFGSSYGNSAKAKQDQTKSSIDKLKGPSTKTLTKSNEEVEETTFASKLIEKVRNTIAEKKDVVMPEGVNRSDIPAAVRKARGDTPLTVADVKGPKKDSISAPENLAKAKNEEVVNEMDTYPHPDSKEGKELLKAIRDPNAQIGKPQTVKKTLADTQKLLNKAFNKPVKEEVEQVNEDNLDSIAKKHGMEFNRTTYGAGMKHPTKGEISINRYGEWHHTGTKAQGDSTDKFASLDKHLGTLKEEADVTTDTLAGRKSGGDENSFTHFKKKIKGTVQADPKEHDPEETSSRISIKAKPTDNLTLQKLNKLDPKFGKTPGFSEEVEVDEATIAGTSGWKETPKNVTDKSGAVHTPMSRAKDLARSAFTAVQNRTKIKSK